MVPVHCAHRPRSVIYTDDREPANVHVVEAGLAMVHLFGSDGRPEGAEFGGSSGLICGAFSPRSSSVARSCWRNESASMAQLTDEEFEAATRRGEERSRSEPRAVGARFDGESARVIVELANGCIYIFPAEMAEEAARGGPNGPGRDRDRRSGLQPALAAPGRRPSFTGDRGRGVRHQSMDGPAMGFGGRKDLDLCQGGRLASERREGRGTEKADGGRVRHERK